MVALLFGCVWLYRLQLFSWSKEALILLGGAAGLAIGYAVNLTGLSLLRLL